MNGAFTEVIKRCKTPIIELGCGSGNNTLHLSEEGKKVVACDFSNVAIQKIGENIPEARTMQFNMKEKFPFSDNMTDLIVADLSLHYFSEKETRRIISEISRVLTPDGYMAFRVNSTKDTNYGASNGLELETNYYEVRGTTKRFFNESSILDFFGEWDIISMHEEEMKEDNIRTFWDKDKEKIKSKKLWTCLVQNRKSV